MPAGIAVGTTTTGHHITLLPKLAPSWEKKISPAVTAAPAAVRPARVRSKRPGRTSRTAADRPAKVRSKRPVPTSRAPLDSRLISLPLLGPGQVLLPLLLGPLPEKP